MDEQSLVGQLEGAMPGSVLRAKARWVNFDEQGWVNSGER